MNEKFDNKDEEWEERELREHYRSRNPKEEAHLAHSLDFLRDKIRRLETEIAEAKGKDAVSVMRLEEELAKAEEELTQVTSKM